jgi:hypothetical protein
MHPNAALIERFYSAFAKLDTAPMAACYAPNAHFADEVFTLDGRDAIMSMWIMLCEATRKKGMADWALEFSAIDANDTTGTARWDAHYRFSATGRLVHNIITAKFTFADGLIVDHHDSFDFWRWSRQALGAPGLVLGWSPMLRNKVRAQAARSLAAFQQRVTSP